MPQPRRPALRLAGISLATALVLPSVVQGVGPRPTAEPRLQGRLIRAAAGERLSPPDRSGRPEDIARRFVEQELVPAGDLSMLGTLRGGGGVAFVSFEQRFEGQPVHLGRITVAVDPDGAVLAARVGELAPKGPPPLGSQVLLPTAESARAHVLAGSGFTSDALAPSLRDDAPAIPLLVASLRGAVRAWSVRVAPDSDPHAAEEVLVGMDDGRLLRRFPTHFEGVESGRVWPSDPASPSRVTAFVDPVTNPSAHSPLGWTESLETAGNNAVAYLDRDGTLDPAQGSLSVASGDPPVLDFDYTGDPVVDVDAAVTNVFWALNFAHDRFRAIGFNEASGALQEDNYGRGGLDGDRVNASVQNGSLDGTVATNRVSLGTGRDGTGTTLRVGLFENAVSGLVRDAAFETDLLVHEYAHGVTARMIEGNPACLNGQQPSALAEGFSDFFAASMTGDPVIGGWLSENPVSGFRAFALDANPLSYLNLCAGARGCNAINDGEIWGGTLWKIRELFITEHGVEGLRDAERLILESLRYAPCRPTFLDARDAILLADEALFGGEHWCALWGIFAGRGMGVNASSTGPSDELPTVGFQTAPACIGGASVAFDKAEYGLTGEVLIDVGDPAPLPGATVRVESSSGDSEALLLETLPGGPRLRARVDLDPGPPTPGDGLLQVSDGDDLTATYEAGGASGNAVVNATFASEYLIHLVLESNCQAEPDDDHADAPGYFIPGFLDAGEAADIIFAFNTFSPTRLPDTEVTVMSLNPNVGVLPTRPVRLGTIAATEPGQATLVLVTIRAVADPAVISGEEAELLFHFSSEGRTSEQSVTLTLNMDYEVVTGASPFAGGVETFEADSPTRDLWTHQANRPGPDGWRMEACAGAGGTTGYGNTDAACTGYPDNQGVPVLVSPPLFADLPADAVAWRYEGLEWQLSSELWVDPDNLDLNCDFDMAAAFLTDDRDSLPYDDPGLVLLAAQDDPLGVWAYVNNTMGYVPFPATLPTGGQALDPAAPIDQRRLAFVLWNDVINETTQPLCSETANQGNFLIDDVAFSYEYVRVVPEATPCTGGCSVFLDVVSDPPGPKCAGEPFVLDASASEISGCSGDMVYSFTGPGIPPEYGFTTQTRAPAAGEDDGDYVISAACDADLSCAASLTLRNPPPQLPGIGGPFDGTLRVRRQAEDLVLSWVGAAGPPAYGAWRASSRAELAAGIASWPLVGVSDDEGPDGEGELTLVGAISEPGLAHYQVLARDRCSDAPILP